MLKLTLENEYGIFAIMEKDAVDVHLEEMRSIYNRLLRCAGYVFDDEEEL